MQKLSPSLLAALLTLLLPSALASADITINASSATPITLPTPTGDTPVSFKTPDGHEGWVRHLSSETIPTPAYANGRIFTGSGMGSALFSALDAFTGKTLWQ